MTSYLAHGFDGSVRATTQPVHTIVDGQDHEDARVKLQRVFGDRYSWISVGNISPHQTVPEEAKNVIFISDKELYTAAPDLNPRRRRKRR